MALSMVLSCAKKQPIGFKALELHRIFIIQDNWR